MITKVRQWWEDRAVLTFEADIRANKRYLLYKNIKLNNDNVPYAFYDIETDDRKPLVKDDRGNVVPLADARILSWALVDMHGNKFAQLLKEETDESEKELIGNLLTLMSNYGVISGWFSEKFDMPYIKGRCEHLGISYAILDFINHMDYLELFKKYDRKSRGSFSLNAISNEVLNESKLDQPKGNGLLYKTYKEDPEHLLAYNLEDSNLIYKINDAKRFIEVCMKRANTAGCHIRNTMNNSDSGDYLLMREFKASNIIMPSKPNKDDVEERKRKGKIGGGFTTCYEPGIHEEVAIIDFKSEYPSIIRTWNISPETYVGSYYSTSDVLALDQTKYCVTPKDIENGVIHPHRVYRKDKEGVVPRVVRKLIEARDAIRYTPEYKEMKKTLSSKDFKKTPQYLEQYAFKTDSNSIYGILSFIYSRYYSWDIGDSVTAAGRATMKHCYENARTWGITVVGGDTDSGFFKLNGHDVEELNKKFEDLLEIWTTSWSSIENKMQFVYDKTWPRVLLVMKKHYAYIDTKGEIVIKGMEAIKTDTNSLAAKLQKDFIYDVLKKEYKEDEWKSLVEVTFEMCYNQNLNPSALLLTKALTKMPDAYIGPTIDSKTGRPKIKNDGSIQMKSIPAHVNLARRLMSQGVEIYPGSKIKYIVIKEKPILAISLGDWEKGQGLFDYKHKKKGMIQIEWTKDDGYAAAYYWQRIIKPLIKVVFTYYMGILPDWNWGLNQGQMNKMLARLNKDDEDE